MRVSPAQGIRVAAAAAALTATSLLAHGDAFAGKPGAPPVSHPFDVLAQISVATVQPTPSCQRGFQTTGVALDVRGGIYDGLWWNSLCIGDDGVVGGRWAIFYISGRAADAIIGSWESNTASVGETGLGYSGTYVLEQGYGPYAGTRGGGEFVLNIGPQAWVTMNGEVLLPEESAGSLSA